MDISIIVGYILSMFAALSGVIVILLVIVGSIMTFIDMFEDED